MRAIWVERPGGLEALVERELPLPEPGPGQVRVRVRAASFNPVDAAWRRGEHGAPLPGVLGRDCAGVVDALGPGVRELREGDEVFCYIGPRGSNGTYAEYVCVPASMVAWKPAGVDFAHAAAIPVGALTAYHAVVLHARAQRDELAFVAGPSGGVGSFAMPLLRLAGTRVLATAGSDAAAAFLEHQHGLAASQVLRYDRIPPQRWAEALAGLADGAPLGLALDFVGGAMKRLCLEALAPNGRCVSIVEEPPGFEPDLLDEETSPLVNRSLGFHFVQLSARARHQPESAWRTYRDELQLLGDLATTGQLTLPPVENLGPLSAETAREGHRQLETGRTRGKRVMSIS